jgi:nitrogen fixation protein NifZ
LLVAHDTAGEVVQAGMRVESETPVYPVEFAGGCVVGCLKEEIAVV